MRVGDTVTVVDVSGNKLVRAIVGACGSTIYVCRKEELSAAKSENRDPICIGFKIWDVVGEDCEGR